MRNFAIVVIRATVCNGATIVLALPREVARARNSIVIKGYAWHRGRKLGRIQGNRVAARGLALVDCDLVQHLVVVIEKDLADLVSVWTKRWWWR